MTDTPIKPIFLVIIDGLGIAPPDSTGNLFNEVDLPAWHEIIDTYPVMRLTTPFSNGVDSLDLAKQQAWMQLGSGQVINSLDECVPCLAKILAQQEQQQVRLADIYGYSYITYFMNGKRRVAHAKEKWINVSLPEKNNVKLSSPKIMDTIKIMASEQKTEFYTIYFSNLELMAKTGSKSKVIEALAYIDSLIGELSDLVLKNNGVMILTSTHGLIEQGIDDEGDVYQARITNNDVPLVLVGPDYAGTSSASGDVIDGDLSVLPIKGHLYDIAPTILKLKGIELPDFMEGKSLI